MKGVLLVNLGTPDSPSRRDVAKYLREFLTDGRVIDIPWLPRQLLVNGIIAPFRSGSSAKMYKMLWTDNGSPLKYYGLQIEKKVQQILGSAYKVKLAMRYQSPSIKEGIEALLQANVTEIIVFPMFPQYASATTGSVHDKVMEIMRKEQLIPNIKLIGDYFTDAGMLDLFIKNAQNKYTLSDYDHILFSFHGLPQRQLRKGDRNNHCLQSKDCCQTLTEKNRYCYAAQCHATAFALADKLKLNKDQYTICYQSRLGRDPWTQPYTSEVLKERRAAGDENILVFCPAFVADCLETTVEISFEYKEEWEELGGHKLDLVESLNDKDEWAATIARLVQNS